MCEEYCAIHRLSGRCLVLVRFGFGCGFGGIVVEVLEVAVCWCVPSDSGGSLSVSLQMVSSQEVGCAVQVSSGN